jgi:hypothetical protein
LRLAEVSVPRSSPTYTLAPGAGFPPTTTTPVTLPSPAVYVRSTVTVPSVGTSIPDFERPLAPCSNSPVVTLHLPAATCSNAYLPSASQ